MLDLALSDIQSQLNWVVNQLKHDELIMGILNSVHSKKIKAYLGAGCINQRLWNILTHRDVNYGISDYDLVYFDDTDISKQSQDSIQKAYEQAFPGINIECTNEARVHIWYQELFGKQIEPYKSVEDAVNNWPTTASAIAVRLNKSQLEVFAPFGLTDLLSLTLRPNKNQITQEVYESKCKKWTAKWPELNIVEW